MGQLAGVVHIVLRNNGGIMSNLKFFIYSHWLKWHYKSAKHWMTRQPTNPAAGNEAIESRLVLLDYYPTLHIGR